MSAPDAGWLGEVRERAPKFIADFENRMGEGDEVLVSAACERSCRRCVRECAIRGIHARLWRDMHREAEIEAAAARPSYEAHGNVVFPAAWWSEGSIAIAPHSASVY